MYVDSHCHLSFPELAGDIDDVVGRMRAAKVTTALNVCVTRKVVGAARLR